MDINKVQKMAKEGNKFFRLWMWLWCMVRQQQK